MPSVSEIVLFVRALPIAMAAQRVREEPVSRVIEKVLSLSGRVGVDEPDRALRAARRACNRWARWFGGLDTCLTRSLVAGGLLSGSHEVLMHIGFRPTDPGFRPVDGHAWLEVDGEKVELTGLDHEQGEPYQSAVQLRIG